MGFQVFGVRIDDSAAGKSLNRKRGGGHDEAEDLGGPAFRTGTESGGSAVAFQEAERRVLVSGAGSGGGGEDASGRVD